jgi:hypothetical protein
MQNNDIQLQDTSYLPGVVSNAFTHHTHSTVAVSPVSAGFLVVWLPAVVCGSGLFCYARHGASQCQRL